MLKNIIKYIYLLIFPNKLSIFVFVKFSISRNYNDKSKTFHQVGGR